MEAYTTRIKANAENLAKETFPKKALELDDLINSDQLATLNISKIFQESDLPKPEDFLPNNLALKENHEKENQEEADLSNPVKKRKIDNKNDENISGCKVIMFPNGAIKTNSRMIELIKIVKPYIIHFLDSSAMLKLWIQILIPQVEDFKAELSLQIQEETLAEIRAIEAEVANYLDHIYKYYAVRGKLVSKFAKYPHVCDIRQSICELDEKMFMTIRLIALELRNHYTTVHDILIKNLEKIKKPRQDMTHSMY